MHNGKVVRNAGTHRILTALSQGNRSSKALKQIVGAINSVARFEGEYMKRLTDNGLVRRRGPVWELTQEGRKKVAEMGNASGMRTEPVNKEPIRDWRKGEYKGTPRLPRRPGSEDFLKHPSRMADEYVYPNKDKDGNGSH